MHQDPAQVSRERFAETSLLTVPNSEAFLAQAEEQLQRKDSRTVISRLSASESTAHLAEVKKVFTDLDGTIIQPGETELDQRTQDAVRDLASLGVEVIAVTGKPFAEIQEMIDNHGLDFPMSYLFEKGAFALRIDSNGTAAQENVLATDESVASTKAVRDKFHRDWKQEIEGILQQEGTPVRLEPAGTGTHQCVLSIDILDPALAGDDFSSIGGGRDAIKIHDTRVIDRVVALLDERVKTIPGFEKSDAVDLGNANIEWSPANSVSKIDKDLGVAAYLGVEIEEVNGVAQFRDTSKVPQASVLGDSGNDRPLFRLSASLPGFKGHLVYHERTPADLLPEAHFVSTPLANGAAHLEIIALAKRGKL